MGEIYTKFEDGIIFMKLDQSLYEKEAVMAAAYKMTDSCHIIVKPLENSQLGIYFEPKDNQDKNELQ
jgi:His-Xaa-Ser system protein HxsD